MIKVIILLITGIISHGLFAQKTKIIKYNHCEIIHGDTINCTVNGSKTGYWIIYEPQRDVTYEGKDPNENDYSYLIAEGEYNRGVKIGIWKYYYFIKYGGYGQKQFVNKTIIYNLAGIKDSTETHYYDSSTVESIIHWSDGFIDSLEVLYTTGIVKCKAIFKMNNVSEFWIYYPGGELKYYGTDIDEFKIGNLEFFDSNGAALTPRTFMLPDISIDEGLIEFL